MSSPRRGAKPQVQQNQPEITVHQPAPIVTVDIPQPRITIRMPEPDVNVSQSQPQVQVEQGQPEVDLESLHSHNLAHLSGVLHHGQKQGEIRTDLSAEALSDFLLGMVHHRALALLRGEAPPPGISRQIIDVFIHGARS